MRSNYPIINVYKKNNIKSEVVTQLLFGDTFQKIYSKANWIKIKINLDQYKGFIKKREFTLNHINTHKVYNLFANMYSKPNNKNKINKKLSFASKIKVIKKKGNFYKFDRFWIKKKDLKKINYTTRDIFKNIKKFINIKYKWGGKCFKGVDCSGLVQLFLNYNNKSCPRDAKNQLKHFKKKVILKNIKKNDLIFWKGHVAVVFSKTKVIHAYGPLKKVVLMSLKKTIRRIYRTANLRVIGIRRID